MDKKWWQHRERGGIFLLKFTCFLVKFTPKFLLKPIIFFVSFIYFICSKKERENINFYLSLLNKRGVKTKSAFYNFYNFADSICDKILVWSGKITQKDIIVEDKENIKNELINDKKGRIFLVSHFGNIDIARAVSTEFEWLDITILLYAKQSVNFNKMINQISVREIKVLEVGELDIASMLKLKSIIDSGGHIGIMGDRAPLSGAKSVWSEFLGESCEFPVGAFVLASLLECGVISFWSIKNGDKFEISFNKIADSVKLGRDKNADLQLYLKRYLSVFERMCERYPHLFFNFYDFWQRGRDDRV